MAMRARTVEILIEKAKFDPPVALAVAEAIDNEMQVFQPVTVPVLDGRLTALSGELNSRMSTLSGELNGRMNTLSSELNARMTALSSELNGRMTALESTVNARLSDLKAEIIRWTVVLVMGQVALLAGIMHLLLRYALS